MAQKRKPNHSKKLADMVILLKKIEEKTARAVKGQLGDDWRDNLFEIMMTRIDLATPHKKEFAALRVILPAAFREDPKAIPRFARTYCGTMKRILKLADAPAHPHHVAAFCVLYASIIDTFLKDTTRDHAKTMAALDKRLGLFEQLVEFSPCKR